MSGYFTIYIETVRYLYLTPVQAMIFSYILSFKVRGIDEDGYCFASRDTMARALNISKSTLDSNLKKLVSRKLICKAQTVSHNHVYYQYSVNTSRIEKIILEKKQKELDGLSL